MNDGQAFWRLSGAHRHLVERFRPRHATPAPWGEQEDTAYGGGTALQGYDGFSGFFRILSSWISSCPTPLTTAAPQMAAQWAVGSPEHDKKSGRQPYQHHWCLV